MSGVRAWGRVFPARVGVRSWGRCSLHELGVSLGEVPAEVGVSLRGGVPWKWPSDQPL